MGSRMSISSNSSNYQSMLGRKAPIVRFKTPKSTLSPDKQISNLLEVTKQRKKEGDTLTVDGG